MSDRTGSLLKALFEKLLRANEDSLVEIKTMINKLDKRFDDVATTKELREIQAEMQEIKEGNDLRNFAEQFKRTSEPSQLPRAPGEYNRKMYSTARRRRGITMSYYDQG